MRIINKKILLEDEDLKEIFSLFCSPTKYEVEQIYSDKSSLSYRNVNLQEEYSVTLEKKEFSIDAWRSILLFLHRKGVNLLKDGEEINLSFIEKEIS